MKQRKIQENETVAVRMTAQDRTLLLEHTFVDPDYAERLRPAPGGRDLVGEYTLDDLEDILGYVAAEANHATDARIESKLRNLYERLYRIQRSYDDGLWNDSSV